MRKKPIPKESPLYGNKKFETFSAMRVYSFVNFIVTRYAFFTEKGKMEFTEVGKKMLRERRIRQKEIRKIFEEGKRKKFNSITIKV